MPISRTVKTSTPQKCSSASLTDADLEAFDINAHESLNVIATLRAEEFSHTIFESFTVMRSDKTVVELCEGGAERQVTAENRKEYLSLARTARLHESSNQIEAVMANLENRPPEFTDDPA